MPYVPVRVMIKVHTKPNRTRRPRMFKWVGYERRLADLWGNGRLM